jgi:hypothetical protein
MRRIELVVSVVDFEVEAAARTMVEQVVDAVRMHRRLASIQTTCILRDTRTLEDWQIVFLYSSYNEPRDVSPVPL